MRVACLLLLGGAAGFVAPASRPVGARARDEPTVLPDPWWFRALEVRWSAADQLQGTLGLRATQWWLMRTERLTKSFCRDFLYGALVLPNTDEATLDDRVGRARERLELAMVDEARGWLKRANPVLHLPKEEPTFGWALSSRSEY